MSCLDPCLIRSRGPSGEPVVRLGMPLVDEYLEFLAGRCRPNTVLAAAYDLKVFFAVVGKPPAEVGRGGRARVHHRPAHRPRPAAAAAAGRRRSRRGVGAARCARRLSSVSGLFAFLQARGDVAANPVPRGLPTRRERQRPGQGVPLVRRTADAAADPDPGRGRRADRRRCAPTGTGRWSRRWCSAGCAAARSSGCGWRICGSPSGGCSSPRARAATSGWCRSRRGSSPRSRPTSTPNGPPDAGTDRVFVVLKGPRPRAAAVGARARRDPRPAPGAGPGWPTRPATSCGTPA